MQFNRKNRIRTRNRSSDDTTFSGSKFKIIFKILIILGLLGLLSIYYIFSSAKSIGSLEIPAGNYNIKSGTNIYGLPSVFNLKFSGFEEIKYKLWLRNNNYTEFNLQAGNYNIPDTDLENLFINNKYLSKPSVKEIELTILPGYSIFDIDELLTIKKIIAPGEFIKAAENIPESIKSRYSFIDDSTVSLEGMCYPDTYRLNLNASLTQVLIKCLDNFNKKVNPDEISNFKDILNLASIVQKEERNPANKAMVAGILQKRIDESWGIGADATICYGGRKTHTECNDFVQDYYGGNISIEELSDRSYDTRAFIGLPITPIGNVTADTVEATINYEKSPYYYYLHGSDGQIHYGVTLQDHVSNKQYL